MHPFTHNEIYGNWATLLLSWNSDETLDYARTTSDLTTLIAMQVSGIYINGTAGEFYSLTEHEFDQIALLLTEHCEVANVPFQIGASHMSAQISLERLKRSVALAPATFQIILPDWYPLTDEEAIDFLYRMADAAEGIGLVLYNPPHAKRVLSPETIGLLAREVPSLVGVKVAGGNDAWYASLRQHLSKISVFVSGHHLASGFSQGAQGSYSNVACLHPRAAQHWWECMSTDLPKALEMEQRIQCFMNEHIIPFITNEKFSNAAVDRFLAQIGDWGNLSEGMRWPYRSIPRAEANRLRPIAQQVLPEFFET